MKEIAAVYLSMRKTGKDKGRAYVNIRYKDKSTKTMWLARYLMEQHLGRELLKEEQVDHKDEDKRNDAIENLQILTQAQNMAKRTEVTFDSNTSRRRKKSKF